MKALAVAVFIIGTLAVAAPAFAVQDKKSDEQSNAEKRVCRSETVTGSMMPKRICHTASEWKQMEQGEAQGVEAFRNRAPTASGMRQQ